MNVVCIYESRTGTTRQLADNIAMAAHDRGADRVVVRDVDDVDLKELAEADLVFVGTWVDGVIVAGHRPGGAGKFNDLPNLWNKKVATYCTYAVYPGSALRQLSGLLASKGAEIVASQKFKRGRLDKGVDEFVATAMDELLVA